MSTGDKARACFAAGFNCAQATLLSLCELTGMSEEEAARAACGFGGGMRAGELCGATTGAVLAIGMALGNTAAADTRTRDRAYAAVIEFNRRFKEVYGSLICRELIGCDTSTPEGKAQLAQNAHLKDNCSDYVALAAQLAGDIIKAAE